MNTYVSQERRVFETIVSMIFFLSYVFHIYIKYLFITELSQTFLQNLMKNISNLENACIRFKTDELSFKTSPNPVFTQRAIQILQ